MLATTTTTQGAPPELRILPPIFFDDPEAALAYWLANPLLNCYPRRLVATLKLLPTLSLGDKQDLVSRLKKQVINQRKMLPLDYPGYNRLLHLVRHELVSRDERVTMKPMLLSLRGAELESEYTRLETAIRGREQYVAYPEAA